MCVWRHGEIQEGFALPETQSEEMETFGPLLFFLLGWAKPSSRSLWNVVNSQWPIFMQLSGAPSSSAVTLVNISGNWFYPQDYLRNSLTIGSTIWGRKIRCLLFRKDVSWDGNSVLASLACSWPTYVYTYIHTYSFSPATGSRYLFTCVYREKN